MCLLREWLLDTGNLVFPLIQPGMNNIRCHLLSLMIPCNDNTGIHGLSFANSFLEFPAIFMGIIVDDFLLPHIYLLNNLNCKRSL